MAEPDRSVLFAQGPKAPEAPHAPIPGQPESKEKAKDEDEQGVPRSIKIVLAVLGGGATLAGIIFGIWQIIAGERHYQEQRDKAERDFQLQLERERGNLAAQMQVQVTAQKKAEAEAAEAQERIADSKKDEADAEARKSDSELQRIRAETEREKISAEREVDKDRRLAQAEQFKELETNIAALRSTVGSTDLTKVAAVAGFLNSQNDDISRRALDTLDARLEELPSRSEIDIIFEALPNAGIQGLDVAVRANRRAWKGLRRSYIAEYLKILASASSSHKENKSGSDSKEIAREAKSEIFSRMYVLRKGNPNNILWSSFDHSINNDLGIDFRGVPAPEPGAANLESVIEVLLASQMAIDRALYQADSGSEVYLDYCFLPAFTPERMTPASKISLRGAYLAGADFRALRGLENTKPLTFVFSVHQSDHDLFGVDNDIEVLNLLSFGALKLPPGAEPVFQEAEQTKTH